MPEFLSDAWIDALDVRARTIAPEPDVDTLVPELFVIEQVVTDVPARGEVRYSVAFSPGGVRVVPGGDGRPDVTFATDHATAVALARGDTNAQRALAAGRFSVRGNIEALVTRAATLATLEDVFAAVRAETTYP